MRLGRIDFPSQLIKAIRSDRLVVFAGTGVSMGEPACLPDFKRLVEWIIKERVTDNTPLDRILGIHHHRGVHVQEIAKELLSDPTSQPTLKWSGVFCRIVTARRAVSDRYQIGPVGLVFSEIHRRVIEEKKQSLKRRPIPYIINVNENVIHFEDMWNTQSKTRRTLT